MSFIPFFVSDSNRSHVSRRRASKRASISFIQLFASDSQGFEGRGGAGDSGPYNTKLRVSITGAYPGGRAVPVARTLEF